MASPSPAARDRQQSGGMLVEIPEDEWRSYSYGYDFTGTLSFSRLSRQNSGNKITRKDSQHSERSESKPRVQFAQELTLSDGKGGEADSAGLGKCYMMAGLPAAVVGYSSSSEHDAEDESDKSKKIGELAATAICGNDITASCFYVVGELAKNAGVFAPVCTLLSSITLYCFRSIYGEVVTALPLNGGVYNLLLNSTSKRTASVSACLTILSYTATGVVSAVSAANYLASAPFCHGLIPIVPLAVTILGFFACLMILGMGESAMVASVLFVSHLLVLFVLLIASSIHICQEGLDVFFDNCAWPHQPPVFESIFYGFSSAMLGVSGFETSANFVEEQAPGVFPKTLTNMWASVSVINITLPILATLVLPLDDLVGKRSAYVLSDLAEQVAGPWLGNVVAIDALLVLSGSVLTSYVGVTGLIQRMAGDRCLPHLFGIVNSWRGTPHWTILIFFGVCASMCILTKGEISKLAAIYSLAFLTVMALFAFCGVYMKFKRPTLPRPINTHTSQFVLGFVLVAIAFSAVVQLHPGMLVYFWIYYGGTVFCVMIAFMRIPIFMWFLTFVNTSTWAQAVLSLCVRDEPHQWIMEQIANLWSLSVVYFAKSFNLSELNRALQYIEENEEARHVRIIHCHGDSPVPYHLMEACHVLDCLYPKLRIDCIVVPGEFGPPIIPYIVEQLEVLPSCMFINCPRASFHYAIQELGGVRVILNSEKSSLWDRLKKDEKKLDRRREERKTKRLQAASLSSLAGSSMPIGSEYRQKLEGGSSSPKEAYVRLSPD